MTEGHELRTAHKKLDEDRRHRAKPASLEPKVSNLRTAHIIWLTLKNPPARVPLDNYSKNKLPILQTAASCDGIQAVLDNSEVIMGSDTQYFLLMKLFR